MTPDSPSPRQELECSVTALLLGELSAEQAAALREVIANDPELTRLHDRLKHAIDLVRQTESTPVSAPTEAPAPLKLSEQRRQELLQQFKTVRPREFARPQRRKLSWLVPVAAGFVLLTVLSAMLLPSLSRSKSKAVTFGTWGAVQREQPAAEHLSHGVSGGALKAAEQELALNRYTRRAPLVVNGTQPPPPAAPATPPPRTTIVLPSEKPIEAGEAAAGTTWAFTPTLRGYYGGLGGGGGAAMPPMATPSQPAPPEQSTLGPADAPEALASRRRYGLARGAAPTAVPQERLAEKNALAGPETSLAGKPTAAAEPEPGLQGGSTVTVSPVTGLPRAEPSGGLAPTATPAPVEVARSAVVLPPLGDEARAAGLPVERPLSERPPESSFGRGRTVTASSAPAADERKLGYAVSDGVALKLEPAPDSTVVDGDKDKLTVGVDFFVSAPSKAKEVRLAEGRTEGLDRVEAQRQLQNSDKEGRAKSRGDVQVEGERLQSDLKTIEEKTQPSVRAAATEYAKEKKVPSHESYQAGDAVIAKSFDDPSSAGRAQKPESAGKEELIIAQNQKEPARKVDALREKLGITNGTTAENVPAATLGAETLKRFEALRSESQLLGSEIQKIREVEPESKPRPSTPAPIPQPEIQTSENAFSTFSLNVSDVSFKLAAASLEQGVLPEPGSIRSEEFINAFDYRDPEPGPGAAIAFAWERARYPFAQNRDLLRLSLKTAAQGRQAGRPLNLVLLLDNSGSMERADRVRIIQEALRVLAGQLQPQDKLSVVLFARTARLWLDGVPGDQAAKAAEEAAGLTPQGGTNLEEAMNLGYQTALRHYAANGINRVVLLTDGAANLGDVAGETLRKKVEAHRKQGIALDAFGIGWEGYNDDLLEELTRNGDGRYGFINTPEEAATGFAGQLAGALQVAASDVKVQVEFNPNRVTAYRQIGYAKHQLTKEQFRDNMVDAAEIGAAEAGNALYVVEVNPRGQGPLAIVRVRYKVPGTADYREQEWPVPYNGTAVALAQATPSLRLAACATAFSEWLASSPYAAEVTPDALLGYLRGLPELYGADARPKKLEWMLHQAGSIAGK